MATTTDITYFDTPAVFKFWALITYRDGRKVYSPVVDTYNEAREWAAEHRVKGDRTTAVVHQRRIN